MIFTMGNLNKDFGKKIGELEDQNRKYEIRATEHSLERFSEKGIDIKNSVEDIKKLGFQIKSLAEIGKDVAIANRQSKIVTIISFEVEGNEYQIRIRTIIKVKDFSRFWIKEKTTKLINLFGYQETRIRKVGLVAG